MTLTRVNWELFRHLYSTRLHQSAEDPKSLFTFILDVVGETIPKTLTIPNISDICKDANKKRARALDRFKREPTEGTLNACRIVRDKARKDIRDSKKASWRNYVSKINSQTSVCIGFGLFVCLFVVAFFFFFFGNTGWGADRK